MNMQCKCNCNIRILDLDVRNRQTPSNVVLYSNTLQCTILQFNLYNGRNTNFQIPINCKVRVFVNNEEVRESNILINNRCLGRFTVTLDNYLFNDEFNVMHELNVVLSTGDSTEFDSSTNDIILTTSVMYLEGIDPMTQSDKVYKFPNTVK